MYEAIGSRDLVAAASLAMFIGSNASWSLRTVCRLHDGTDLGLKPLASFTYSSYGGLRLWQINAGYPVVISSLMGVVLGA